MKPLIVALPGNRARAESLAAALGAEVADRTLRRFPDGETYVQIRDECAGRDAFVVGSLDRPDAKLTQTMLVASTLRDLGARRVGLVAPYLAYLRQDIRFNPGEGITSQYIGQLISEHFDWLACVEPHLHRYDSLGEVYAIPATAVHATEPLAGWVEGREERLLLVGPDVESAQWVERVAEAAGVPSVILEKTRHGDRDVEVSLPEMERWPGHVPVLLDDIISTGGTMAETVRGLLDKGIEAPVCVGVHAIMAEGAQEKLLEAGARDVVTTDTIEHPTNAVEIGGALAEAVAELLDVET